MLFVPLWQLLPAYVRQRWLTQHDGRPGYRARVWLETRDRSRSRRRHLDDCEPAQEHFSFGRDRRTLGRRAHCVSTDCRSDRVEFAHRDSGKGQRLAGVWRCDHDHWFRYQRAQESVAAECARSRAPA